MAPLLKKLDHLLRAEFEGASTELEPFQPRPKVGGFVIWAGFAGVDMADRVRSVWALLARELSADEMKRVALILPFTPVEMAIRREELAREENAIQRSARVGTS